MPSWLNILIQVVEVILQGLMNQKAKMASPEVEAEIVKCQKVLEILKA